ncbi:MAG: ubiquitin-like domain-containing protein [Varibaculum sp.]|nr:ubiquitin-like domain-containing protein [Varibaculum sp.]
MNAINAVKNSTFAAWLRGEHELTGRQVLVGAVAAAGLLVLTAGTATAVSYNTVTVSIDGATRQISGFERNVGQLLAANQIKIGPNDLVEPAQNVSPAAISEIRISRAEPVAVIENGRLTQRWVSRTEAGKVPAADTAIALGVSRGTSVADTAIPASKLITVKHDGTSTNLGVPETVQSADELINTAGIELEPLDQVKVVEDVDGTTITVERVERVAQVEEKTVAHEVKTIENDELVKGKTRVKTPGRDGKKRVSTFVEKIDGEVVHSSEPVSQEIEKPVTEVVEVGTKESSEVTSSERLDSNNVTQDKTELMAQAGISEGDYGYVDYIINRESGWNANAINSSSGACGLPQALPCSKIGSDWNNPVTALKWANGYAVGRYGSWASAYNAWRAQNWW